MIVASIDIGTNTVLLLIAEIQQSGFIKPLLNEYRMPRIGKGIEKTGEINTDKIKLLYDVLKEYEILIKNYNCEKVLVTGTNALRIAKNASKICNEVKKLFNYQIDVISGDLEAEYAFLGATSNLKNLSTSLIIDIGGGSTELIFGEKSEIINKKSIEIGSVRATEKFLKHSPPPEPEIENLRREVNRLTKDLIPSNLPGDVIAIAGTATTLSCMNLGLKEFLEEKIEMSSISKNEMNKLINELTHLTSTEILRRFGPVMKGREDIILAGALILFEIMNSFGIESLKVSSRGIRYGAIVKYIMALAKS